MRTIAITMLIFTLPFIYSQNKRTPIDRTFHHEVKDHEMSNKSAAPKGFSPAYSYQQPGIKTVQVNVDSLGRNIVGDAANEPSIAINRNNPKSMAIGWRQFNSVTNNFRQAGFAYTTNKGTTWKFPGIIEPGIFRSDPVLESDAEGNFYYNSLTNDPDYFCKVFKSTNGGAAWDSGVDARGGDKQWMTIDKSNSIGEGNIYANWNSVFSTCSPGSFTKSVDRCLSFIDCIPVTDDPFWGTLTVDRKGTLYVCGVSSYYNGFSVIRSENAKNSVEEQVWDMIYRVDLDGDIIYGLPFNPDGLAGQVQIAVDTSGGIYDGYVYLLSTVSRISISDQADVMFARSSDGGQSWSSPIRINDDMLQDSSWQWFGTMSVAPNGRIDVVWLDTRENPGKPVCVLYYSCSSDGGETWSPNKKMSEKFNSTVGWPNQRKMGDYYHMISDSNGANLAWAATFNGEEDVYYSYISDSIYTAIKENEVPSVYSLSQNYPNPFNPYTTIDYQLAKAGHVNLRVYDILGNEIAVLVNENKNAGNYSVVFDAVKYSSGVYFYSIQSGEFRTTRRMVLLK